MQKVFCLAALLIFLLSACQATQPIQIGLAVELSGKQSELGVNIRNGVLMAVDEINQSGGVQGRKIELVIEDDQGTNPGAQDADRRLIASGVTAIIGHLTSAQTVAGYAVTEPANMVLLSPTAATSQLTNIKDHFFRVFCRDDLLGAGIAEHILLGRGLKRTAIIFDADNRAYGESLADMFVARYTRLGGVVTTRIEFSSSQSPDFEPLVEQLRSSKPDAIFFITAGATGGLFSQQVRLKDWNVPLFAAPWAQGDSLIQNGGKAVDGLSIVMPYDPNSEAEGVKKFSDKYLAAHNKRPAFTAFFGYEAMQVLAAGLRKTNGSAAGLTDALSQIKQFQGLNDMISMDAAGDAVRPLYVLVIRSNSFATVNRLTTQP